ncbi:MAG: hypothetical protein ABIR06_16435, partial [Cyclobacteriaceae bacterium]
MRCEFENIESLIGKVLALSTFKGEDSKKILDSIGLECERIKKAFNQLVLSAEEEKKVRRYFHFHQESLVRLINKIHPPARPKAAGLLAAIKNLLVDLHDTFKSQFAEFFDDNGQMPDFLKEDALFELGRSADSLREKFISSSLDPQLFDLVVNSFRALEVVSYQKLHYIRHLQQRLLRVDISINDPDLLRQDFCKVLVNCNYNAGEFFEYYTGFVKKALINCETLSDRIDLVSWFLKGCYQEQCLQNLAFDRHFQPIHVQLAEWLSHELDYYRQKQQLLTLPDLREHGLDKDFKLNFDISVSQLAYLFKAFIDTGVIRNKNTSQLIRFLVKFVKTKKSE